MVVMFSTKNYEEFTLVMKALEGSKQPIFVVFTGTNDVTGTSWCPDCVKGMQSTIIIACICWR